MKSIQYFLMISLALTMMSCNDKKASFSNRGDISSFGDNIKGKWFDIKSDGRYVLVFENGMKKDFLDNQKTVEREYRVSKDTLYTGRASYLERYVIEKLTDEELHIRALHLKLHTVLFFRRKIVE